MIVNSAKRPKVLLCYVVDVGSAKQIHHQATILQVRVHVSPIIRWVAKVSCCSHMRSIEYRIVSTQTHVTPLFQSSGTFEQLVDLQFNQ